MKRTSMIAALPLILGGTVTAQQPASPSVFLGYRLGEIRSARHRALPCTYVPYLGLTKCTAGDSSVSFLGDTLVAIDYEKSDFSSTPAQIWRDLQPRTRRAFGVPDHIGLGTSDSELRDVLGADGIEVTWKRHAGWRTMPGLGHNRRRGWQATATMSRFGTRTVVSVSLICSHSLGFPVAACP